MEKKRSYDVLEIRGDGTLVVKPKKPNVNENPKHGDPLAFEDQDAAEDLEDEVIQLEGKYFFRNDLQIRS